MAYITNQFKNVLFLKHILVWLHFCFSQQQNTMCVV